jgi:hypothetical protein
VVYSEDMDLPSPYEAAWLDEVDRKHEELRRRAARAATAVPDAITGFLASRTAESPAGSTQASVLYREFIRYLGSQGWDKRYMPSLTVFGTILSSQYPKRRTKGAIFYLGLILPPADRS